MDHTRYPRATELPRPRKVKCPYDETYTADVLVIGCGFAGLNAAVAARTAGQSVLVMDKGRPGYSGQSPWVSGFRWFDPERGDEEEVYRAAAREDGEYICNMNWFEQWLKESKDVCRRLTEWGILSRYPTAAETGEFFARGDFAGYRETFDRFDRRKKWTEILDRHGIPWLEHTMAAELLMAGNCAAGALGLHVPSGQLVAVRAKAVVLATGGGCYKPAGCPAGGNTFDGEYMAYQLGLPIAGKEFEAPHTTSPDAPGNALYTHHWQYLENIWLCGGDLPREDGTVGRGCSRVYETDPEELRSGRMGSPGPAGGLSGAAAGMCGHLASGVFCGWEELDGGTGVPGLYVAGDGIHAAMPTGAADPCGSGFASCFASIDGDHAGRAAAEFAARAKLPGISAGYIRAKKTEVLAPLSRTDGFDPNWARDALQGIMAPYWVSARKTEETLRAALVQVEHMRDHVVPRLAARSGHDLRLCIEMRNKVLSAEMKLRAGLARRESRGSHYRADIPFRNDEEFLDCVTVRREGDGMAVECVPVPAEWTGDRDAPYEKRYRRLFPGEPEAKKLRSGGKARKGGKK